MRRRKKENKQQQQKNDKNENDVFFCVCFICLFSVWAESRVPTFILLFFFLLLYVCLRIGNKKEKLQKR